MNFLGANVTIPHKVSVISLLDGLAESAAVTGAVNTIVNDYGRLEGHNTDGVGFIRSLEERVQIDYSASPAFIAGAGGAARSVAVALAARGTPRITIVNRTRSTALELKELLEKNFPALEVTVKGFEEDYDELLDSSKLIINATPLGMEGALKSVSLRVDKISSKHIVYDIVYTSRETPLLVAAKEKGATILGGQGMLLHQGAAAFQLWTGIEPPIEVMKQAIES